MASYLAPDDPAAGSPTRHRCPGAHTTVHPAPLRTRLAGSWASCRPQHPSCLGWLLLTWSCSQVEGGWEPGLLEIAAFAMLVFLLDTCRFLQLGGARRTGPGAACIGLGLLVRHLQMLTSAGQHDSRLSRL